MRRIQIFIEEEVDEALTREALARHTSKAALIREYVRRQVTLYPSKAADPSLDFVGAYDGSVNESGEVDEVLYGR